MSSINKVILVGNLGQDPTMRTISNDKEIASFTLATSTSWKDKQTNERKDKTEWHRVVIFNNNLVSFVKNYLTKGSKIYLEGSLQTRKWVDKSGIEKYTTEIVLQNYDGELKLLDSKNSANPRPAIESSTESTPDYEALDDEIPF